MKYICFGYLDVQNWEKKSQSEQEAMIDACFSYDDELKKNGHWVSGEGLEGATTLAIGAARCPSPTDPTRRRKNYWADC